MLPVPDAWTPVDDGGGYALAEEVAPRRPKIAVGRPPPPMTAPRRVVPAAAWRPVPPPEPVPGSTARPYHYLVLLLAMLPLAWATFRPGDHAPTAARVAATVEAHPEVRPAYDALPDPAPKADVLAILPGDRCDGALLPYDTWDHWGLAAASAAGFFGLILLLFPPGHSKLWHLALIAAFTGTAGIFLLLAFQFVAFHVGFVIPRGALSLAWDLVALIGQSYRMALGDHGVVLSAIGFTAGVGLCEETCKALPLLFKVRGPTGTGGGFLSWRSAMLWGLVSGVGFGVSEGITYSSDYYNGVRGGQIYVVRFVSCVALHAIWAAAVGIAIYRHRASFVGHLHAAEWLGQTVKVIVVPMCLHGLYDTLLKQQYDAAALGVALASFGWLAFQVELAKRRLDPAATPNRQLVTAAGRGVTGP